MNSAEEGGQTQGLHCAPRRVTDRCSVASQLSLCWGDAARPAECCSGMDASGGRGLAVLAGGYKGTLPGWAGSRVRTTGCWATTVERGPLWASPVAMSSRPLHPELTAAPLTPSWQYGTVPHLSHIHTHIQFASSKCQ